jgi:mitochondrial fission protein ELM1
LLERLGARHAADGGSFLVSVSRRTPAPVAARLRDAFAGFAGAFWSGSGEDRLPSQPANRAREPGGLLPSIGPRLGSAAGSSEHLPARTGEGRKEPPAAATSHPGENPYAGFLAWADRIIVTPDSVNMLSEACATGKPVYTFTPRPVTGKLAVFHRELLGSGHLRRLDDNTHRPQPAPLEETTAIAELVRERWQQSVAGNID